MRKSDMVRKGEDFRKQTTPAVVPSGATSGLSSGGSTIPLSPTTLTHETNGSTNNTHQLTTPNLPNGIIAKKSATASPSDEDACPNCGLLYNATASRKLTESCGHLICRSCVVMSEEGCIQCLRLENQEENSIEASTSNDNKSHPPTVHSDSEPGRNVLNIAELPEEQIVAEVLTPADTPESIVVKEETEEGESDNLSPKQFQDAQKEDEYNILISKVHSVITSNIIKNADLISAGEIAPDNLMSKPSQGHSDNLSPEQFQDVQKVPKGDDGPVRPVVKTKRGRKRNPVKVHDHITVLGGNPPMYQCNVCQKKFKTKDHVKYHEFCQKGEKPFECKQCGQGFITKSHYEYHLRVHSGERPFVCPKCGKGFAQRGKVTRHMRSHTGEKPFTCQECNRGFANAHSLRSHTFIHTGERPFACTHCNRRFTALTNLKRHVIAHTGERPFSCQHCGKCFGFKWTLDLHLQSHSSDRPYPCDQCCRAFSSSLNLRRHLGVHSGERPFRCLVCSKAFRRKDNLLRHVNNTHNQPKKVAKKLADDAAVDYLKLNKKNHSLDNIVISKVHSVITSNITNNANLIPAGGIVPNDLKSKPSQGHPDQLSPEQFQDMQKEEENDAEGNDGPVAKKKKKSPRAIHDHITVLDGKPPTLQSEELATAATKRRPTPRDSSYVAASAEPKTTLARQSFPCRTCGLSFRRKDAFDIHIENTHNQPEDVAKNLVDEVENDSNDDTVECILPHDVDVDVFDDQIIVSKTGKAGEIYTILDIDQLELDEREINSVQQSSPFTGKLLMSPCPSPSQWTDETKTQVTLRLVCTSPPLVVTDIKPESLPLRYNLQVDNDVKVVPDSTPPSSPSSSGEKLLIASLEPRTSDPLLPVQEASSHLKL